MRGHTLTVINQKDSTCTAEGYTGDQFCTTCEQIVTAGATIEKKAHSLTVINRKDATYDAEGYTGDEYCTTCEQIIHTGTVTPKLERPTDPQPELQNVCPWCGGVHEGFFQGIVSWFHSLLAGIFGAKY